MSDQNLLPVSVVTPWLDHPELHADYWTAIAAGPSPEELLIVDDGSQHPLADVVARFPFHGRSRRVERSSQTRGFHRACNLGLRLAAQPFVVFLNNDIRLASPGWLRRLLAHAAPPDLAAGIAGPGCDPDHAVVDGERVPYIEGWCLAAPTEAMRRLGGFDERFLEPAYFGDNELCIRARMLGMPLRPVEPIGLVHLANRTVGRHDQAVLDVGAANYERYAQSFRTWRAVSRGRPGTP